MTEPEHAETLAGQVAAGAFDPAVLRWLAHGFSTWARAGGAVRLERALGVCATPGQRRRLQRNAWLAVAARELPPSDAAPARALHQLLAQFITRGLGRAWRDLESAPPGAARLNVALFEVARCSGWRVLSVRRLEQLLPGNFEQEISARDGHDAAVDNQPQSEAHQ